MPVKKQEAVGAGVRVLKSLAEVASACDAAAAEFREFARREPSPTPFPLKGLVDASVLQMHRIFESNGTMLPHVAFVRPPDMVPLVLWQGPDLALGGRTVLAESMARVVAAGDVMGCVFMAPMTIGPYDETKVGLQVVGKASTTGRPREAVLIVASVEGMRTVVVLEVTLGPSGIVSARSIGDDVVSLHPTNDPLLVSAHGAGTFVSFVGKEVVRVSPARTLH